ncbi:hypothetical protein L596_022334 [Steinernema carpocapsae]|uniref:Uncharacterized protein n=2 Tax=Steinernema carpocapsae TaxID=34508 RepID=A0A4U5MLT3_STECR|nr:hypothetical protein L596_022334 [Steinernema carpocapsae]
MGLSLNLKSCREMDYTVHLPTLKTILITSYKTFKLFFGSFLRLHEANTKVFKDRLNYFFSRYLSLLKVNQMPLVDYFAGVDFLQLEPVDFLRVETLTAQVQEAFPQIEKVMFLYQNRLMWYSVSKVDVIVLFRYLTQSFLPTSLRAELKPDSHLNRRPSGSPSQHEGKFLSGPSDLTKTGSDESFKDMKCPVVFLSTDEESRHLSSSQLIVYRALNATMCMFVKKNINKDILHNLDAFLGPELSKLASRIGEVYGNSNNGIKAEADYFHFIYYNPVSLSVKTSFGLSTDGNSNNTQSLIVPKSVYRMACEVCENFIADGEDFGQVQCKGDDDWWIVGRKSNGRILILFLPPRPPTTMNDVDGHVNQIIKTHFDSIFVI